MHKNYGNTKINLTCKSKENNWSDQKMLSVFGGSTGG